jgi:hypothetical protein
MNNTNAEEVNTQAASPVSISTPPEPDGSVAAASFRRCVSEMFLLAEEVVNRIARACLTRADQLDQGMLVISDWGSWNR